VVAGEKQGSSEVLWRAGWPGQEEAIVEAREVGAVRIEVGEEGSVRWVKMKELDFAFGEWRWGGSDRSRV